MKKIISLILSFVMIFSVFSIAASATEFESTPRDQLINIMEYYSSELDYYIEHYPREPWENFHMARQTYIDYCDAYQRAEELLIEVGTTDEEFKAIIEELKITRCNMLRDILLSILTYHCWDFDYTPEYWYKYYTKESYDAYLAAKQKAERLYADETATDEDYNNMILEFLSAQDNLEPAERPEINLVLGDINSDGAINLEDAILTQKCTLSLIELSENQRLCADVNEDGNVDILDSIFITKYSLNIPIELEKIGEKLA